MADQSEKKSRGCRYGCLALVLTGVGLAVLAVLVVLFGVSQLSGGISIGSTHSHRLSSARLSGGEDEVPEMREVWSSGTGTTKVIRIPLSGLIFLGEDGWLGDSRSAANALRAIKRATHDPDVEGIILEIDSGGGGITASDIIHKALLDFKQARKGRVIVALMGDVAASGAYYVVLPSDVIMAHPTTITGSIGVIMQSYNIQELAAKIGLKDVTFKSGDNKDLLNPFHDVSPEQKAILQGVIDALYNRFVKLVADGRKLSEADVRKLADGRIFTADDALKAKLIDDIGYSADAEKTMADLLNTPDLKVVRYEEELSVFDLLRGRHGLGASLQTMLAPRETHLMYRWGM